MQRAIYPFIVIRDKDARDCLIEAIEKTTGEKPEGSRDLPQALQAMYPLAPTRLFIATPIGPTVFNEFGAHSCAIALSVPDPRAAHETFRDVFSEKGFNVYVDKKPVAGYDEWVFAAVQIPVLAGVAVMLWKEGEGTTDALTPLQPWV